MRKFLIFLKELIFNPKNLFKTYFTKEQDKPPYFILLIFIYGVGKSIDRLDLQFLKFDAKGNLDQLDFLNSWIVYWCLALVAGIFYGYLILTKALVLMK